MPQTTDSLRLSPSLDHAEILGMEWCLKHEVLPVQDSESALALAFVGDVLTEIVDWACWKLGLAPYALQAFGHRHEELEHPLAVLRGKLTAAQGGVLQGLSENDLMVNEGSSLEELRKKSQAEPVVRLVEHLLDEGLRQGATDIHLEPDEEGVSVRLRRDGLLREFLELPRWVQASLTSRIKILAELDIAEKRLPQDGRIQKLYQSEVLDIRVSTLPTRLGEKVVLRLLRQTAQLMDLPSVGMPDGLRLAFESLCDRPQGMIFVTGPTGSGKSSTLHAALQRMLPRDINVTTIEDPIEYRLARANQVQINEKAGLTFAEALRSLLRQDPDVILVGEIRDRETATIAVQAAQTGHLVFSTLHTNDAVGAVTRLVDLGIPPFLIASAVLGVVGQRLVRRVCPHCCTWGAPSAATRSALQALQVHPARVAHAQGCSHCEGTGYRGRIGIFELMVLTDSLREAVVNGASEQDLRRISEMAPLAIDGIQKAVEGVTTLEEVLRVGLR